MEFPYISPEQSITLIIPTYNEHDSMKAIFPIIERLPVKRVIISDDNSPDGTAHIVQRMRQDTRKVSVIVRTENKGLSPAIRTAAAEAQTEYVAVMDGDGQHLPDDVRVLLQVFDPNISPIFVGSRFVKEATQNMPYSRLIGSSFLNKIAQSRIKMGCTDPMSGMFIAPREAVLYTRTTGFKILYEILRTYKYADHTVDLPIRFSPRISGDSKMKILRETFRVLTEK